MPKTFEQIAEEAIALAERANDDYSALLKRWVTVVFTLGVVVGACLTIGVGAMLGAF